MNEKPPAWADILLTVWVLAVALFFFGGFVLPAQIGIYTSAGAGLYALLLLASVGTLALRYLNRSPEKDKRPKNDSKIRK